MTKNPPKSPDDWKQVWREHRPADLSHGNSVLNFIKKIFRRPGDLFLATRLQQQRDFNEYLLDHVDPERIKNNFDSLRNGLDRLHNDLVAFQESMQSAHTDLQEEMERVRDSVIPSFKEETKQLLDGVDARAEWALARTRRFMTLSHEKTIERFTPEVMSDLEYAAFEDHFRGSQEEIEKRMRFYVEKIGDNYPVWDLGCGRGEFIKLLTKEAIPCKGIDGNEVFARMLQDEGLPVVLGDLFDILNSADEASIGTVTLFHVLEHLPPLQVSQLFQLVRKKLKPGGLFMLEVPNTACLVGLFNFFKDPGHINPWQPQTLQYALEEAGFAKVTIIPRHPVDEDEKLKIADNAPPALVDTIDRLNDLLYGYQDLGAVAVSESREE